MRGHLYVSHASVALPCRAAATRTNSNTRLAALTSLDSSQKSPSHTTPAHNNGLTQRELTKRIRVFINGAVNHLDFHFYQLSGSISAQVSGNGKRRFKL